MARKGLPRDRAVRPAAKVGGQQENRSPSKQGDEEGVMDAADLFKLPRQTYYVPEDVHRRLKILAVRRKVNVSDLAVEGINEVLRKYGG